MKIAIFGKGAVGTGLGKLMQAKGHEVLFAGRSTEKPVMQEMAQNADMALIAVPFQSIKDDLVPVLEEHLQGKIVMDATNPVKSDWSPETNFGAKDAESGEDVQSAAEAIQVWFPKSDVVKVFNTVFADNFSPERLLIDGKDNKSITTFVAANKEDARHKVIELATEMGFDAVETGALFTAHYLESMAHLNIQLAVKMGRGTDTGFIYFDRSGGSGAEN